jgi:hypothetical protein
MVRPVLLFSLLKPFDWLEGMLTASAEQLGVAVRIPNP